MTALNQQCTSTFLDREYPEDPYPGARPACSFVHLDGVGYPVQPDGTHPSGWSVLGSDPIDLDRWLGYQGVAGLRQRWPVLAYGSNACPEKITWLRANLGLRGPVVVLRAHCTGLAAVWSAGYRKRDGQRPAVLAAAPGIVEEHTVWLATADQRRVLDRCEGRGRRYRLVELTPPTANVRLEDGSVPQNLLAYTAGSEKVAPLLVDGRPVRCAELAQDGAARLRGTPARTDGLSCVEIAGEPAFRAFVPR